MIVKNNLTDLQKTKFITNFAKISVIPLLQRPREYNTEY